MPSLSSCASVAANCALQLCVQRCTQRGLPFGKAFQYGLQIQLQHDGTEHLSQRLRIVHRNPRILQRAQCIYVRQRCTQLRHRDPRRVVVLHQQARGLASGIHQHAVLLIGFQRDAVTQP